MGTTLSLQNANITNWVNVLKISNYANGLKKVLVSSISFIYADSTMNRVNL